MQTSIRFFSIAISTAMAAGALSPMQANAADSLDYPAVIVCSVAGKQNFAYLSAIEADGSAQYMSLTGAFATFDPEGQLNRPNQQAVGDCAGKSIQDLRDAGQTREFAAAGE